MSVLDWSLIVGIIGVVITAAGVSGGLILLRDTRSETRRIMQDIARSAEFRLTVELMSPSDELAPRALPASTLAPLGPVLRDSTRRRPRGRL